MQTTELQKKIIESPASARAVVKAGPGTGKTFSLIERLKYLIKDEHLEPALEILVLSFSVAAAQEIKKRLQIAVEEQGYNDELLYVNIRTFDSFASSFMYSLDPDIELDGADYDQRISMATEIIENRKDARNKLQNYRHILVDEVQDLVGPRALLTLAVLRAGGGGFTLFGDPAQAVYNFLMDEESSGLTSDQFLNQVYDHYAGNIAEYYLGENFRVEENESLKAIADMGRKYLIEGTPKAAYNFLRRTFADLTFLGNLNDIVIPDELRSSNTACLCRTNGQVLRLARHFADQGVTFSIRRPLDERQIPAWVGKSLSGWKSQTVKKKDFLEALGKLDDGYNQEPLKAWQELKATVRAKSSIRVPQLRKALIEDGVFFSDSEPRNDGPILSTVHRSKGREFKDVVLAIPEESNPDSFLDEGRVMFVGLTRARRRLFRMSEKGAAGIRKGDERWFRSMNAGGRRRLTGIEVGCRGDIDIHSPVSREMFDQDDDEIMENQQFLGESVRCGCDAKLKFYRATRGLPVYYIMVSDGEDELAVALTSERFGQSLKNTISEVLESRPSHYPEIIEGLWVRAVVTEVGNLGNEDVPRIYRTTGIWLGVRLQGLGTCRDWRKLT